MQHRVGVNLLQRQFGRRIVVQNLVAHQRILYGGKELLPIGNHVRPKNVGPESCSGRRNRHGHWNWLGGPPNSPILHFDVQLGGVGVRLGLAIGGLQGLDTGGLLGDSLAVGQPVESNANNPQPAAAAQPGRK